MIRLGGSEVGWHQRVGEERWVEILSRVIPEIDRLFLPGEVDLVY